MKFNVYFLYNSIVVLLIIKNVNNDLITINYNGHATKFNHFWKSTGFCPPDPKTAIDRYLLSDEMEMHLKLISSLPNNGIEYVRVHYLINLIQLEFKNDYNNFNFTYLDKFVDILHKNDLIIQFELMGWPLGADLNNPILKSEAFWENLTFLIVKRYIDKFGMERMTKWKFELWNEPDLKNYNILNFNKLEYFQYAWGCSKGIDRAFRTSHSTKSSVSKEKSKLGGPAGLFRDKSLHPLCWSLLEACNNTGSLNEDEEAAQCPVQFISFHKKGNGTMQSLLDGTLQLLDLIYDQYPGLRDLPIVNDESDLETNWSKSEEWRGDERYGQMVVQLIYNYYKSIILHQNIKMSMSNDNGFLNYYPYFFTQRTLFARFQINNTHPPHNQFIKKPIYTTMGLLALMGDEFLIANSSLTNVSLTIVPTRYHHPNISVMSIILAGDSLYKAKKLYHHEHQHKVLNVILNNLPANCNGADAIYGLDNMRTNPMEMWKRFGKPDFPNKSTRQAIRSHQGPIYFQPVKFNGSSITINATTLINGVYLVNVCCKSPAPNEVQDVRISNVTADEILITWKYKAENFRCIRTYEVEQAWKCPTISDIQYSNGNFQQFTNLPPDLHFKRVNSNGDTIFLSYHYAPTLPSRQMSEANNTANELAHCELTRGYYRVRAVDYWDRPGPYSEIIFY